MAVLMQVAGLDAKKRRDGEGLIVRLSTVPASDETLYSAYCRGFGAGVNTVFDEVAPATIFDRVNAIRLQCPGCVVERTNVIFECHEHILGEDTLLKSPESMYPRGGKKAQG